MQEFTDTTTHAGWRDYVDELTLEQIEELISWEGQPDGGRGSSMRDSALLVAARSYARRNRWAREYADVPAPADAGYTGERHDAYDSATPARYFEGFRGPLVHVGGLQLPDGSVRERWISITTDTDDLDASTARSLARQLAAAADQLEQVAFAEAVAGLYPDGEGISWREAAGEAAAPPLGAGRGRPALFCAHADVDGDADRCTCTADEVERGCGCTADAIEQAWGDYPVDSAIRSCCQGIGAHTQVCTAVTAAQTANGAVL